MVKLITVVVLSVFRSGRHRLDNSNRCHDEGLTT